MGISSSAAQTFFWNSAPTKFSLTENDRLVILGPFPSYVPNERYDDAFKETLAEEARGLAALVRVVVGNPIRAITLAAAHRTPTVVSLAHAAYDERRLSSGELDPHRLAALADALEEAGAAAELVAHLRGPGPHVRDDRHEEATPERDRRAGKRDGCGKGPRRVSAPCRGLRVAARAGAACR